MKLLLVEDDKKIATVVKRGPRGRGLHGRGRLRRRRRAVAGDRRQLRPDRARHHAAAPQRLRDLRRSPGGRQLDADPDAHRQGRRPRRSRGTRHGSRRLPDQAVLVPGARRRRDPVLLRGAGRGATAPVERRRPADRPGRRDEYGGRPRDRADGPPVRRARVPDPARRARSCPNARSSTASGSTTSRATRTSSRSTSAGSGPRSTSRSVGTSIETVRGAGYRLVADGG